MRSSKHETSGAIKLTVAVLEICDRAIKRMCGVLTDSRWPQSAAAVANCRQRQSHCRAMLSVMMAERGEHDLHRQLQLTAFDQVIKLLFPHQPSAAAIKAPTNPHFMTAVDRSAPPSPITTVRYTHSRTGAVCCQST